MVDFNAATNSNKKKAIVPHNKKCFYYIYIVYINIRGP